MIRSPGPRAAIALLAALADAPAPATRTLR